MLWPAVAPSWMMFLSPRLQTFCTVSSPSTSFLSWGHQSAWDPGQISILLFLSSLTLISLPNVSQALLLHVLSSPSLLVLLCSTHWFLYWMLNNNMQGLWACSTSHGQPLPELLSLILQVNRKTFCHLLQSVLFSTVDFFFQCQWCADIEVSLRN